MSAVKRLACLIFLSICGLVLCAKPSMAQTQDTLCDDAFQDCRQPLWDLIDNEKTEIDVAYWFMQDTSLATKIIARFNAGVKVRILVDPRADSTETGNADIRNQFQSAGIPLRYKLTDGILHWKFMIFASQNTLQFSGADYSSDFFVAETPNQNYIDEAIYFTTDPSIVNSFMTKFDDTWTDTTMYGNLANINGPLTRSYATSPINPELNFPPSVDDSQDFYNRTLQTFNNENQKIDVIMYRITNLNYTNLTINTVKRGIPVRLITEQAEYRNPSRPWDAYNVDLLYMGGVQLKFRAHQGLIHEKAVVLYGQGMTIFGSSNWTGPSTNYQAEHNYFTVKTAFFSWFVNQFETKWNSSGITQPFAPLPPDQPTNQTPVSGTTGLATDQQQIVWLAGTWAPKFDIYFGTNPNPPLLAADQFISTVDDPSPRAFTLPTLAPNTTYYWRIVSKTMANQTASGPVWSFTTAGSGPANPAPTVSGIAPASGTASGGTAVTITGTNFGAGAAVSIGGVAATNVVVNSATSISAVTAAHAAGQASVVVTNSDGQTGTLTNGYTYSAAGGGPAILLADNFAGASVDTSKWVVANLFSGLTDSTVPVTVSASQLQIGPLYQNTGGSHYNGITSAASYNFTGANAYVRLAQAPSATTTADAMFTIGSDMNNYYRIYVESGNLFLQKRISGAKTALLTSAYSATNESFLRIRHDSSSGNVVFEVAANSGGAPGAWTQLYNEPWNPNVAITAIQFELKGGTWQAEANVPGTVSYANFQAAVGSAPPAPPPSPAPTISSISPASGPTAGGTTVTITGANFVSGAGVTIGGVAAGGVSVTSSTSISATTPALAAGTYSVVVTNPDGQSATLTGAFTATAPPPAPAPSITRVTPNSGPNSGGTAITITGANFVSGARVAIGSVAATGVTVTSSTSISATTPALVAGTYNVVVTNPDGQSGSLNAAYTATAPPPPGPAPTVSAVSPNSGTTSGGTAITITGTNFVSGATVAIGNVAATGVSVTSSTSISATTPAVVAGTYNLVVTNPDGQSATLTNGYTYTTPPSTPTTLLADNFSGTSVNTTNWVVGNLFSGTTDTTVPVTVASQQLQIGPLTQNTTVSRYNGIRSASVYDFTGAYAFVHLVHPGSASTGADAMLTIGNDVNNYYRIYVEAGNLIVQKRIGGTAKTTMLTVAYNAVNHSFLRIRHDATAGKVVFETAPNSSGSPGTWTQLYSEVWSSSVSLTAIQFELKAGTWQPESSAPGTVSFSNFQAVKP